MKRTLRSDRPEWRFTPFWKLTNFGFLQGAFQLQRGCDEWHNLSLFIYIPLVGEVVRFATSKRDDEEHLWAIINGDYVGAYFDDCIICQEFLQEFHAAS